jgi:HAMP domain-containing protein
VGQAASLSGIDIALQSTEAGIDLLARGDQPMTAALTAVSRAYQAWQAGAADPQLADLNRGDVAAARALQADLGHVTPLSLAVRTTGLALQSQITSEQQTVTGSLSRAYNVLLGALIAMIAVVTAIAALVIMGVWRGLLRPFDKLNKAVAAVADGRYNRTIPAVGPPELADLSRGVELMRTKLVAALSEREQAQESLRNLFDLAPDAMSASSSRSSRPSRGAGGPALALPPCTASCPASAAASTSTRRRGSARPSTCCCPSPSMPP